MYKWIYKWMNECRAASPMFHLKIQCMMCSSQGWILKASSSGEEEVSLDKRDRFCLFSFPSLSPWEQAPLRVASTMREYASWTKCSWAKGQQKPIGEKERALHSIIPPDFSHTHSSISLSHCRQGFWRRNERNRSDSWVRTWQRTQKHPPSCTKAHKERSRGIVIQAPVT